MKPQSIGLGSLSLWERVRVRARGVSTGADPSTGRRPNPLPEGEGEGARAGAGTTSAVATRPTGKKLTPILILFAGIALAFVPQLGLPAFYDSLLYLMLHWVVLATSWNILSGYSGYFSFGHGAFFGAGIYTTST